MALSSQSFTFEATWIEYSDITYTTSPYLTETSTYTLPIETSGVDTATTTVQNPFDSTQSQTLTAILSSATNGSSSSGSMIPQQTSSHRSRPSRTSRPSSSAGSKTPHPSPEVSTGKATSTPGSMASFSSTSSSSTLAAQLPSNISKPPVSARNGIPPAGAAGIGVGCALAAAMLSAVLVWYFMRRRNGLRPTGAIYDDLSSSTSPMEKASACGPMSQDTHLDEPRGLLLGAKDGRDLARQATQLSTEIRKHAARWYCGSHAEVVPYAGTLNEQLEPLIGTRAPIDEATLSRLLMDRQTTVTAVQTLLSWSVLSNVLPSTAPERSLLPPELAECIDSMKGFDFGGHDSLLLLSKWRYITGTLMQSTYSDTVSSDDPRQINIRSLAQALYEVLEPFAYAQNSAERLQELHALVEQGALLGYDLFVQPATMIFEWHVQHVDNKQRIVVFPALVQTTDNKGALLAEPERRTYSHVVEL